MNSFASSGIYPVNRAGISDEQLMTDLTFNPDDEEAEKENCLDWGRAFWAYWKRKHQWESI